MNRALTGTVGWLVLGAIAAIAAAGPGQRTPNEPPAKPPGGSARVPVIQSVLAVEKSVKGPVLLYFTADEWKAATKDAVQIKEFPKNQLVLEAVPLPGGPGDMLVGVRCPPGCTPLLTVKGRPGPKRNPDVELTPHPDTIIIPECDCSGVPPDIKDPTKPRPSLGSCRLVIRRVTIGELTKTARVVPLFVCENIDCTRNCRFGVVRQADGRILLGCLCE